MYTFLIGGYFGAGNLGDEAILECMLKELRLLDKDLNFIVTSWKPEWIEKQHHVQSIHWKDVTGLFDAVQKSDLVILGGGGLFQDYWGLDPTTYLRANAWDITAYGSIPLLANLNNTPSMIYSVGIGPLKSDLARQHTKMIFENCQVVTLRDHDSLSLLEKCGYDLSDTQKTAPKVLADPVFSLTTSKKDEIFADEYLSANRLCEPKKRIGIVLRFWDFLSPQEDWIKNISEGVRMFLETHNNFDVLLFPFHCNKENAYTNDDIALDKFGALLNLPDRVHKIQMQFSPRQSQALIKRCDLILGMRLHSLIMGINTGTPIIGLPYDPKVSSMMKCVGLEEYCCPSLMINPEELSRKLEKGLSEQKSIRKKMSSFQKIAVLEVKRNASLAIQLAMTTPKTPTSFHQNFILNQAKIIHSLDRQISQITSENLQQLNHQHEIIDSLNHQINQITSENLLALAHKDEEIGSLFHQNSQLSEKIRDLENKINENLEKLSTQDKEISNLNHQSARSKIEIRNLKKRLMESSHQLSVQSEEISSLNKIMDLQDSIINEHIEKSHSIQSRLEYDTFHIADLEKENQIFKDQLNSIYSSKSWKMIGFYYNLIGKTPLKNVRRILTRKHNPPPPNENSKIPPIQAVEQANDTILSDVITALNARNVKGIFVVTSTFEFDRKINQRGIHLTRFLSQKGWGIIFIAWRWSKDQKIQNIGKEVYKNVFQIPVDTLIEQPEYFREIKSDHKYFVMEFPFPGFLSVALQLKNSGYEIVYDIIDEWEEFFNVDQASWYKKEFEQSIVLNADHLTAVSQPLADKFKDIRKDITIIPNGFDPDLIGKNHYNISKKSFDSNEIHIGYFGHLTASWFDWDFLLSILERCKKYELDVKFHIIGHGEPNLKVQLETYPENLFLYGRVEPGQLHTYAKNWNIAMIPFKPGKLAESVDPIKIYEYAFFGLPVIVTGIKHLEKYPNVRVVSGVDEFFRAISFFRDTARLWQEKKTDPFLQKITQTQSKITLSDKMIADSTWEARFSKFVKILESKKWIF